MNTPHINYMGAAQDGQVAFNPFPALVIGGPPHSGKSVLAYSLTEALRAREVEHYLLRAYPPDGEGDWFFQGELDTVRHFRLKGTRSEAWLPPLRRDIANRHLPLLVDFGGLPTSEQETLLDACTHAVLLTPNSEAHHVWETRCARHGLVLVADARSDLQGVPRVEAISPLLRGVLAGLERGARAEGPLFEALVERVGTLFQRATPTDLRRRHREAAPVELAVDLERLAQHLGTDAQAWRPDDVPDVLDYLPVGQPVGLYGRGPNWLYAAVAAHAFPAPFYLFDVRLGWVATPTLRWGKSEYLQVVCDARPQAIEVRIQLPDTYLDITDVDDVQIPRIDLHGDRGVILNGKLPFWLLTGLVRAYARAPWLAVVQPQLGTVVVAARPKTEVTPGDLLATRPTP